MRLAAKSSSGCPASRSTTCISTIAPRSEYRNCSPGRLTSGVVSTSASAASRVAASRNSGRQAGKPDECVSRWRMVTASLPAPRNSGRYCRTGASSASFPLSTSIMQAVVSATTLVTDARS